jgi:hypothetical protein
LEKNEVEDDNMTIRNFFRLLTVVMAITVAGCGGGGGGGGGAVPLPATQTVTVQKSKSYALANGADSITLIATVSPAVADGTTVTFLVTSGAASVTPLTATTVGSKATAAVTSGTTNNTVTVTASTGHGTGSATMKFIAQPASAVVNIALNTAIINLETLNFKLASDSTATFISSAELNQLLVDPTSLLTAGPGITDPVNTISVGLISVNGFSTVANTPIIQINYNILFGVPTFQVSSVVSATTVPGIPLTLTPSNFVVTVTYNDGGGNPL